MLDATGIPSVQEECVDAVRPGGTVVYAGIAPVGSTLEIPASILTRQEKTIMGTYYGTANPARDFPLYADLHLQGRIHLDRLITKTFTLKQVNEAFDEMLKGSLARGVIVMT